MNNKSKNDSFEIARVAGVSRSTVSRVLNRPEIVSEDTRRRVMNVIAQHSYTPNLSAQLLTGMKPYTIGLFICTQPPSGRQTIEDSQFDYILRCVLSSASIRNYHTLVTLVFDRDNPAIHQKIKEMFLQNRIEGGVFIGFPDYYPVIETLIDKQNIVGIFDGDVSCKHEPNRIVINFDSLVGESAVDYLVSMGHHDIAAVHGDMRRHNARQKHDGFLRGMIKHQLSVRDDWMLFGDFDSEQTACQIDKLLKSGGDLPTAIFATNDRTAYVTIQALNNNGLRVPDDISIVGVDDEVLSRYFTPKLTTFRINFKQMLDVLIGKVIEAVEQPLEQQFTDTFSATLVERDSCRRIPGSNRYF